MRPMAIIRCSFIWKPGVNIPSYEKHYFVSLRCGADRLMHSYTRENDALFVCVGNDPIFIAMTLLNLATHTAQTVFITMTLLSSCSTYCTDRSLPLQHSATVA